jgi:hypothetical protein
MLLVLGKSLRVPLFLVADSKMRKEYIILKFIP